MQWYESLNDYEKTSVNNTLAKIDNHKNELFFDKNGIAYILSESEDIGKTIEETYNDKRKGKIFRKNFFNFVSSLYTLSPFELSLFIKNEPEKTLIKHDSYVRQVYLNDFTDDDIITLNISTLPQYKSPTQILPEGKLHILPTWNESEKDVICFISGTREELFDKENIYTFSVKENLVMTYNPGKSLNSTVDLENDTGCFINNLLRNDIKKPSIFMLTRRKTEQVKQFFSDREKEEKSLTK